MQARRSIGCEGQTGPISAAGAAPVQLAARATEAAGCESQLEPYAAPSRTRSSAAPGGGSGAVRSWRQGGPAACVASRAVRARPAKERLRARVARRPNECPPPERVNTTHHNANLHATPSPKQRKRAEGEGTRAHLARRELQSKRVELLSALL
eukprot:6800001-Prymnesium_polylepis.1